MSIRKLGIGGFATVLWVTVMGVLALPVLADTAPSVTVDAASALTATTAHISGTVNPHGGPSATTWTFEYSKEPVAEGWTPAFGGEYPEGSTEATATTPEMVEGPIEGLQPNTSYQVRLVASNAGGEASPEPEVTAKTSALKPSVDSESANAKSTSAMFEAKINPNNQETGYSFEWATEEALLGTASATTIPGAPPAAKLPAVFEEQQAGPVDIGGGLTPGKTYWFRVVATNEKGETTDGPPQSFTTLPVAPIVTTAPAQSVSESTAVLFGTVNPGGSETTYHYVYIDQSGYETGLVQSSANPYAAADFTSSFSAGADTTVHQANPAEVTELFPGTAYHYALIATNAAGTTVIGPDQTFTTTPAPAPPAPPAGVSESSAPAPAATLPSVTTVFPNLTSIAPLASAPERPVTVKKNPKKKSHKKSKKQGKKNNKKKGHAKKKARKS